MNDQQEIPSPFIDLVAHVERICQEHGLIPPLEMNAVGNGGGVVARWEPEGLLHVALQRPIILRLRDVEGTTAEVQITELTLESEWINRFLQ